MLIYKYFETADLSAGKQCKFVSRENQLWNLAYATTT